MSRTDSIPVWEFNELNFHHFGPESIPLEFQGSSQRFHINRLQGIRDKINFPLPPHRKPYYDFLFLTNGSTRRGKALTEYEIGPDSFFFLPAYQITRHDYVSEDVEGYFCHFTLDVFADWLSPNQLLRKFSFLRFIGNPIVRVDKAGSGHVRSILERLIDLPNENDPAFRRDVAATHLMALFAEIRPTDDVSEMTRKESALRITEAFKDALSRKIYDFQLVSEYAEYLNISPNHLNKCVKSSMGLSAQDLLNRMIVLEAKVLLKQTDLSIGEIAFRLCRKNHSDFSRFFKSKVAMTPTTYRES